MKMCSMVFHEINNSKLLNKDILINNLSNFNIINHSILIPLSYI